ncbi:hypothetical protein PVAP13_3KG486614 [Panicum virgatum]|uniref:Uncharacterized protein n=1 Tax=Panicum virgatum TaxID=38727 RepID=A0A8T0US80_PANVG|nr:hypothetical protein PVAP13_3KG486614 [Panicum virgatum]
MGAIDGKEAPKPAFPPFNVPPPAREWRGDRPPHAGSSGQTNVAGREVRRDSREARTGKKTYNNDHPDFGNEQRRPDDHNDGDGNSRRGGHRSGGLYGARSVQQEPVFRERERSPRRHGAGQRYGGRRRDISQLGQWDAAARQDAEVLKFRFLFQLHSSMSSVYTGQLPPAATATVVGFLAKAACIAEQLQSNGAEDWSVGDASSPGLRPSGQCAGMAVPQHTVFQHLKHDLMIPVAMPEVVTVEMVEEALGRIELQAASRGGQQGAHVGDSPPLDLGPDHPPATVEEERPPQGTPLGGRVGHTDLEVRRPVQEVLEEGRVGAHSFFTTPTTPTLPLATPAPKAPRRRRVYDMSNVRRSTRLAKKPAIPAETKEQINLCRKLHLPGINVDPIEKVIAEYIAMYNGPLPEQVVAALSTMFGLDDDYMDSLGDTLLELVG